jgi:putative membrane protein
MMGWDTGWGVFGWLGMGLMMISIWVVPIAVLVWLLVRSSRSERASGTAPTAASPEEVLAQRFARGEIDEDEFNRRRAMLGNVDKEPKQARGAGV